MKYQIGEEFVVEKTTDKFVEVQFNYGGRIWDGAIPLRVKYISYDVTIGKVELELEDLYNKLNPNNSESWNIESDNQWGDHTTQTFKVYNALKSGQWECRVCGPVPKVNPQPAARIRDIKKKGFVIASKRRHCSKCGKTQTHDILIKAKFETATQYEELRRPIPSTLSDRIIRVLESTEAVFNQVRTKKELVIDHKFPSQRWDRPESDNTNSMTDDQIRNKFQLLSNQTNMLKSRECDRCVFKGKRGQFMGLSWYYVGNENWNGKSDSDESGCVGCPWYDVVEWKKQLLNALKKN